MRYRTYSLIASALVLLAACSTTPVVPPVDIATREAEASAAFARGDYLAARDLYRQLAEQTGPGQRSRFEIEVARSEVALGDPEAALATLNAIPPALTAELDTEVVTVRAAALFALGQTVDAVRLLVDAEIWLETSAEIMANQERIWDGLAQASSQAAAGVRTGDSTIDGWLALAPLTRLGDDGAELLAALIGWREEFGNHPAVAGILADRFAGLRSEAVRPGKLALLLPLGSSRYRRQAEEILQGFMAAAYEAGSGAGRPLIEVLDTAPTGGLQTYLDAQLNGADFIVGPLLPDQVGEVRAQAGFVPTLALNVESGQTLAMTNFYQFALSSDDEVEAIATRAIAAGHRTAVVLHASDDFGFNLMRRFRAAYESRGGRVIDSALYDDAMTNLSTPIERLLNVTESEERNRQLASLLERTLEFEPRRRADIDMIFLQAEPGDARLLVSLLEESGAADIPTYSISEVYDPARVGGDDDLDGLIFPDLPLLIDPAANAGGAIRVLGEFRSAGTVQDPRLFAFGFDAYRLAEKLFAGSTAGWPLEGATGDLYLGDGGRIRRLLPFAEFRDGRPQSAGRSTGLTGLTGSLGPQ